MTMKWTVRAFNYIPRFGRQRQVDVTVRAASEEAAVSKAKKLIQREEYEVVGVIAI